MQKKPSKMTAAEKYQSLKRQAEQAGMTVAEKSGKLIVSRNKNARKKGSKT